MAERKYYINCGACYIRLLFWSYFVEIITTHDFLET
jgi:hypothetical protein